MNHVVKLICFVFTISGIYTIHPLVSASYSVHLKIFVWDAWMHQLEGSSPHWTSVLTFYRNGSVIALAQKKKSSSYSHTPVHKLDSSCKVPVSARFFGRFWAGLFVEAVAGPTSHEKLWTSNMQQLAMAILTSFFGCKFGFLGGGFNPIPGKWSNLTSIFFQLGWNHQLALFLQSFFLSKQPVLGSTYIGILYTGNLIACFMSFEKYMALVRANQVPNDDITFEPWHV